MIFIDLTGISLASEDEVGWLGRSLDLILQPITNERGPVDAIVNYDSFDCKLGLEEAYTDAIEALSSRHYKSVKRYSFNAFRRAKLKSMARVEEWNAKSLFREWDEDNTGSLSPLQLRQGVREKFGIRLKQAELDALCKDGVTMQNFTDILFKIMSKFE